MQWTVQKLGWILQVSVGTTAAESMNAASNIFLGQVFHRAQTFKLNQTVLNLNRQTEAPLLIKPFLSQMTKSEIHAVFTAGFATIAGFVIQRYCCLNTIYCDEPQDLIWRRILDSALAPPSYSAHPSWPLRLLWP